MTLRFASALPVVALALLATTCSEERDPDNGKIVVPEDVFHLAVGDSVRIMDPEVRHVADLTFDEVAEDSRCPTGVQCIREGEAVILLTLHADDGAAHPLELTIPGMRVHGLAPEEAPQVGVGAFRFRLLRLDPYPGDERPSPEKTTGTFQVEFGEP